MPMYEGQFVKDGATTIYRVFGEGQPLLFLGGGGVGVGAYSRVTGELAKHFQVYVLDLPGFGEASSLREPWGLEKYEGFVSGLISTLPIDRVVMAGHSLGGGVALATAMQSPKVVGLVLIDSAGKAPKCSEVKFRYNYFVKKTIFDLTHYFWDTPILAQLGFEFIKNRVVHWRSWKVVLETVRRCVLTDFSELHRVHVPVLVLSGRQDEIFSVESAGQMAKDLPHAQVLRVAGNHDWLLFRPGELTEHIVQWYTSAIE